MEKNLSQAQRDLLLMNTAKENLIMKKKNMRSFEQSNKTLEESISKMTECLTSIGDGIASGMHMLAGAPLIHLQLREYLMLLKCTSLISTHTVALHPHHHMLPELRSTRRRQFADV